MPVNVSFSEHGVTCMYEGDVGLQHVQEAAQKYLLRPASSPLKFIVHDFSNVASFHFDEAAFAELAQYGMKNYQSFDQTPRCVLTNSDEIRRSMELYSELTGRKWDMFSTPDALAAWITSHLNA